MTECSKCGGDNAEGETHCAKCGAALVPGEVPQDNAKPEEFSTVCVRVFRGPMAQMEADVARSVLDQEGILCILPGEIAPESYPGVNLIQLLVREEDADKAAEILAEYFDSAHPLPNEEPSV
jgi:putative signal transducing protein